ncbi:Fanconi anemia group F protein [Sceloporus undulatus]|uniref:Fanconi anemia group F protein n=1 Tax=Sceloporus undulatus TaxID=8520 RepID=UPI001C4CCBC6|nr:Fanconi anemia group F protein [Sceloporus undulatus]
METLLSQAEQLQLLLAASRSGLVRKWSPETVSRSLSWARFFRRLHRRLGARSGLLRAALQRRLDGAGLHLGHLGRCPELLALALLENGALPSAARGRLLQTLLFPDSQEEEEEEEEEEKEGGEETPSPPPFLPLLARRKAASRLLLGHLGPEGGGGGGGPAEKAQAQLLLSRLKVGGSFLLEQLPRGPALFQAVAAALLLEPGGGEAEALLSWLLLEGCEARLADFCRSLPASLAASLCARHPPLLRPFLGLLAAWGARLHYDPLRGEWRSSNGAEEEEEEEEAGSWEELAQRLRRLAQEPRLRSEVWAELKRLRAQEGDFAARGLSVWTDLLLDLEGPQQEEQPTLL